MTRIAILQSNYIPWKGYFDLIRFVDKFIIYDDMQYTRRDWRNRNQIKTPQGVKWLSVPVKVKGKYHQKIRDTEIDGDEWKQSHWRSLELNYQKAPHFKEVASLFRPLYDDHYATISELNRRFIDAVCGYLEISTRISDSCDYSLIEGKTERLVDLCVQAGGTEYVSGPAAKGYIDESQFAQQNIKLTWFDYSGYPEYHQLWGDFVHGVTILDLLFNCGKDSLNYMKCFDHVTGKSDE